MIDALLQQQADLPRSLPLLRYLPGRKPFLLRDWDPATVQCIDDLPDYLILGPLDPNSFCHSPSGWSARWQGMEDGSHFDLAYSAKERHWEIEQAWQGMHGGSSVYSTTVPLGQIIGQALYHRFPANWDRAAKAQLESTFQLTVIEQPEDAPSLCGLPDGAFRSIVFPVPVGKLRASAERVRHIAEASRLPYPVMVEAKLAFQEVNYIEGKAPDWAADDVLTFRQSVVDSGLVPHGFPEREVANDGRAAWTLLRDVYLLVISLPFAGLIDFLQRTADDDGPVRRAAAAKVRPELRPLVMPAGLELQVESIANWDSARSTRSVLQFRGTGKNMAERGMENIADHEQAASALTVVEAFSGELVDSVEELFQVSFGGDAS